MPAYFFLELAVLVFALGFGWEHLRLRELGSRCFWLPAVVLALFWFTIDQVAVRLGLWTFPASGGTVAVRLFLLPLEEYMLFFLHTFLCFVLLRFLQGTDE